MILILLGVEAIGVVVQEEVDEEGHQERYCQNRNAGKLKMFSVLKCLVCLNV